MRFYLLLLCAAVKERSTRERALERALSAQQLLERSRANLAEAVPEQIEAFLEDAERIEHEGDVGKEEAAADAQLSEKKLKEEVDEGKNLGHEAGGANSQELNSYEQSAVGDSIGDLIGDDAKQEENQEEKLEKGRSKPIDVKDEDADELNTPLKKIDVNDDDMNFEDDATEELRKKQEDAMKNFKHSQSWKEEKHKVHEKEVHRKREAAFLHKFGHAKAQTNLHSVHAQKKVGQAQKLNHARHFKPASHMEHHVNDTPPMPRHVEGGELEAREETHPQWAEANRESSEERSQEEPHEEPRQPRQKPREEPHQEPPREEPHVEERRTKESGRAVAAVAADGSVSASIEDRLASLRAEEASAKEHEWEVEAERVAAEKKEIALERELDSAHEKVEAIQREEREFKEKEITVEEEKLAQHHHTVPQEQEQHQQQQEETRAPEPRHVDRDAAADHIHDSPPSGRAPPSDEDARDYMESHMQGVFKAQADRHMRVDPDRATANTMNAIKAATMAAEK